MLNDKIKKKNIKKTKIPDLSSPESACQICNLVMRPMS